MLFVILADDGPDSARIRHELGPAHRAYLASIASHVLLAGPFLDGPAGPRCGSLFLVEAATAEAARALVEADPYFSAGLWTGLIVRPFRAFSGTLLNQAGYSGT